MTRRRGMRSCARPAALWRGLALATIAVGAAPVGAGTASSATAHSPEPAAMAPAVTPALAAPAAASPGDRADATRDLESVDEPARAVAPTAVDASEAFLSGPNNDPITLDLADAEMSSVLRTFADFTGLNIIASEHVSGRVTLRLHAVPWRSAFMALLEARGLGLRAQHNLIWVAPAAEIALRARQNAEVALREGAMAALHTESFELRYQQADDVRRLIAGTGSQRLLSKRGAATADPRTNLLFVTDLPSRVAQIRRMVSQVDRPVRQVFIEARIVEAEDGFARNLGARLAFGLPAAAPASEPDADADTGAAADTGSSADRAAGATARGGARFTSAHGTVYDLPAGPLDGIVPAVAALTLFRAGLGQLLTLELSALEADGRGRILSSPRVVTADRAKALIEQGTELPYQAKVRSGVSGVQFRKAGLKLEVTPYITPNGQVTLDVDVAKDSVGKMTLAGPAINTKHVRTQVRVEDGGTVAIGGIYTRDQRTDVARVPWLGRIPLLGVLFRRRASSDRKSELIVFITPTVVRDGSGPPGPAPDAPAGADRWGRALAAPNRRAGSAARSGAGPPAELPSGQSADSPVGRPAGTLPRGSTMTSVSP